jgi:Ca-activated chloride channel family protein
MRLDPLVPIPVIVSGGVVFAVVLVARLVRSGVTAHLVRWVLAAVLTTTIALDPATTGGASTAERTAADVLFVVDSTSSMAAVDYDGAAQRLAGVRADILELAAEFRGAHFALVRFDSQARMELPWTTDLAALETAVSVIRQERAVYSRGSALDLPNPVIDELIPGPRSAGSDEDAYSVVFYFSDGEEREQPEADEATIDAATGMIIGAGAEDGTLEPVEFADLAGQVDGGAVFGYGTETGAPMIEFHGSDEVFTSRDTPYVVDYSTNTPAISRLDEANLQQIADELGVPYQHRAAPGGLADMAARLAADAPLVNDGSRETLERLYWIPALALIAIALWQGLVSVAERRATRLMLSPPATAPAVAPARADGRPARTVEPATDQGSAA